MATRNDQMKNKKDLLQAKHFATVTSSREHLQYVNKKILQNFFAHSVNKYINNHNLSRKKIFDNLKVIYKYSQEYVAEIIVQQYVEKNLTVNQKFFYAHLLQLESFFNYSVLQIDEAIEKIHCNFAYYFLCELVNENCSYFQVSHIHKLIANQTKKRRAMHLTMHIAKSNPVVVLGLENNILRNIFEREDVGIIFEEPYQYLYPLLKSLIDCKILHNETCINYLIQRYEDERKFKVLTALFKIQQQKKRKYLIICHSTGYL